MVELTWWNEYGPRIVLLTVILVVGGGLTLLGRGAGRACERTMTKTAQQYRTLTNKHKQSRRAAYEKSLREVGHMWTRARKVEVGGLYATCGLIAFYGARQTTEAATSWNSTTQWLSAATATVLIMAGIGLGERHTARVRRARMNDATRLEEPAHSG